MERKNTLPHPHTTIHDCQETISTSSNEEGVKKEHNHPHRHNQPNLKITLAETTRYLATPPITGTAGPHGRAPGQAGPPPRID